MPPGLQLHFALRIQDWRVGVGAEGCVDGKPRPYNGLLNKVRQETAASGLRRLLLLRSGSNDSGTVPWKWPGLASLICSRVFSVSTAGMRVRQGARFEAAVGAGRRPARYQRRALGQIRTRAVGASC